MDAAQTNLKKTAFFLATALLLTAPFRASAQPTLNVSTTTVPIGSSSCNDFQNVTVTSSNGTNLGFSVYILYAANNPYGNWLYTDVSGSGSTSSSTSFSAATGTGGTSLTIGLNQEIAAATPSATVVLTPTGGGAATNVTVFYTQDTSCGGNTGSTTNGFFTITPGNIAITAGTTSEGSQTVTIQNTIGSGATFGFSVTPTGSWLSATANSTTISGGGTASVNVTANANQTAGVGTYTGTLTITPATGFGSALNIPVTFTVTSGGTTCTTGCSSSGTLTVGGSTSSTYTASFSYISPQSPADQCVAIQDTTSGADYYQATVSTANGGSWLLANNSTSSTTTGLLSPSSGACVDLRLSNQISTLTSGAYQGQVALTSSSGATAVINVNLYVSAGVAPGITLNNPNSAIYVFPNVAAESAAVQQEVFSVTAATGYTMGTASLITPGGEFIMNTPVFSNNTQSFTVTSNSTGLTTGVYAATVTISSTSGSSTNTTTITIVLPVGQSGSVSTGNNGGGTTSVVAPLSLTFQQQQNSSFWTSGREAQDVTVTGQSGGAWSASIVYATGSGNWLNFDSPTNGAGTFGSTPATLAVDLFNGITSLAPSSTPYQATVSVTTPSGTTSVAVTLLVTPSNTPVLLGLPASSTFSAVSGSNPSSQTVTVVGSDNTSSTTTPPITAGTPSQTWVTATTSGNTMTISASPGSLGTGVYSATIPVSASAYSNPIQYPVVMIVNGGGSGGTGTGTGPLTLSPTSLSFNNITVQTSQSLYISASTNTQFNASSAETTCIGTTWLQASGAGTATAGIQALNVTVFPSGIANGTTCTGVITLTTTGNTQTVNVTMTVGSTSSGSGNVTVSPTSMTFAYTQNQAVPTAQTATIVNAQSGTASISFTVATQETIGTSVTWLQTSVGSSTASTPYNSPGLSVSVVPGSLAPGTYTGSVIITPNGGSAVTIGVTLVVTGNAVVTASPTTLSLTYLIGSTSPTATINVSGGGASAGFTAVAASSNGFLQVTPTSGTTPNTGTVNLNVSVVPTVLASLLPSTTYTGTVTITGTSPATGTTIVNVTLTATAPLPVITGVTNAASNAPGGIAPGELITIYANPLNPIGPATPVQLDSTTCPGTCTAVPTTMGNVQVRFNPISVDAPLTFVSEGQINAVVPYQVAGIAGLSIEVLYLGQSSNAWPINLTATAPGLFTSNASGQGQAVVEMYDNLGNYQPNVNSPSYPAKAGWILVLYLTGEGVVSPAAVTGSVTAPNSPPKPLVQPSVLIGNQPATLLYYGELPDVVSGVLQLNVVVPPGAGTGAVPISVSMGTTSTQASVTVFLQ